MIPFPPGTTRAQAEKKKELYARLARENKLELPNKNQDISSETVAEYSQRWLEERERIGLSSVQDDRGRMKNHILPVIGALPMVAVTSDDIRKLVCVLDDKVRLQEQSWETAESDDRVGISWKTAVNVWGLVSKMFSDACASKRDELRVRKDNPASTVSPPDRGNAKAEQYLYPSEFIALVECEKVPVYWRRLYAVAVYTFARANELAALTWGDIDLEHGVISITKAVSRKTGKVVKTKSGETRRIPIEAELLPLLRALLPPSADLAQRMLRLPPDEDRAELLRRHLERAGVKRTELFAATATSNNLTFHGLRATGITWQAIRGDDPLRIKQRAGHKNLPTTERYIREAENLRAGFGAVFPTLPASIFSSAISSPEWTDTMERRDFSGEAKRPQRDLNPVSSGTRGSNPEKNSGSSGVEEGSNSVEPNRSDDISDDIFERVKRRLGDYQDARLHLLDALGGALAADQPRTHAAMQQAIDALGLDDDELDDDDSELDEVAS